MDSLFVWKPMMLPSIERRFLCVRRALGMCRDGGSRGDDVCQFAWLGSTVVSPLCMSGLVSGSLPPPRPRAKTDTRHTKIVDISYALARPYGTPRPVYHADSATDGHCCCVRFASPIVLSDSLSRAATCRFGHTRCCLCSHTTSFPPGLFLSLLPHTLYTR